MQNEMLKKLSKNLVTNPENYMQSFRENVRMYVSEKAITIKDISEAANIPFETLKSFIYGDAKDCKLSTAVSIAKSLRCSVDELVGCGTMSNQLRESISIIRNLPENYIYFIHWCVKYHERMLIENKVSEKAIDIMWPLYVNDTLKLTNNFELLDISTIEKDIRQKVFLGVRIVCDSYMPIYSPYDAVLIANDRPAKPTEHVLVSREGNLWIVTMKDGKYYSIRDKKLRGTKQSEDEIIGYVAAVHTFGGDSDD